MLVLFVKSQLNLFDAPVMVAAHVRKDGSVVKPHMRIQKVAMHQHSLFGGHHAAPTVKQTRLDTFIAKHGGIPGLGATLNSLPLHQRQILIEKMAEVGKTTPEAVAAMFPVRAPAPAPEPVAEQPPAQAPVAEVKPEPVAEPAAAPAPAEPENLERENPPAAEAPAHDIVEHVTGKGKTLRGIVRKDIDGHGAAAIDPYTFRKNGGWFIREKYLGDAAAAPAPAAPAAAVAADTPEEATKRTQVREAVDKSKAQAAKLREGGEKLLALAQADYGRDRNTNTARRARMASGAEAEAAKRMTTAKTMINLANAIEDGNARYLTGVSTRAAVETLEQALTSAMYEADRGLSYVESRNRQGRDPEPEDIRHAKMPMAKWGTAGSDPEKVVEAIRGKKGALALIQRIRKSPVIDGELMVGLAKFLTPKEINYHVGWWNIEAVKRVERLKRAGISTDNELRLALAELVLHRDGRPAVDPVKAAERALVGQKVGFDFFPTPKVLSATMAEMAGIKPGMSVLEPSAGNGHLADAAREAGGEVETVEMSDALRNVLQAKKHNVVAYDFETFAPGKQYDAVIMNPPFSDRKDALHITRAWDMLKPGGTLVAIAGEGVFLGSDKKAVAFREWLDQQGADVEPLPANTFRGGDLPAQTGANARLIRIEKPADAVGATASAPAAVEGPRDGDRNAEGLVFRDGRWHRDGEADAAPAEAAAAPAEPAAEPAPEPQAELAPQSETEAAEDREDLAEELARNPHSPKAKRLIADAGHRAARAETPAELDEDDPNSPNYRYADTGYIAGARKEMEASAVIKRAKADGAQVLVTGLDWEALEANPREARELITKSNLFGSVDWEALKAGGMEPGAGFVIDRIYAAIGTEPTSDNAQARRDYTIGLQSLRERLEGCKTVNEVAEVLDHLREEFDGKVLTAEESEKYKAFEARGRAAWEEDRAIEARNDEFYGAKIKANQHYYEVQGNNEKRKRRGWADKPEDIAEAARRKVAVDAAEKAWGDELQRTRARRDELKAIRIEMHDAQKMVHLMAYARNKVDNPLHRAWNAMGERFVNVLRFRSYKGSDTFAKHMAAAKAGRVKDWAWQEKEVTRAPRISKASARFMLKVADTYERKGGRDIAPESTLALKEQFGLRDVQSGNWVLRDTASAKFHVESCAAAFADLADLLGAKDSEISLNGRLAMAFGARGQGAKGFADGAARADYSPVHRVINLTKMGGGGCLAHEWFHALDNIMKEAEGQGDAGVSDFATANPDILPPGELRDAMHALRGAMLDGTHHATEVVAYTGADVKLAKHNLQGNYPNSVARMILAAGNINGAIEAIDKQFNTELGARLAPKRKKLIKDWTRIAIAHYGGNPEGGELEVRAGPSMSSFALEAVKLDQGGTTYYADVREMGARAFQSWVEDRMEGLGRKNDYLSAYADNKYHYDPMFGIQWNPYPEGEERTKINAAFDRLFAAIGAQHTLAKALAMMESVK